MRPRYSTGYVAIVAVFAPVMFGGLLVVSSVLWVLLASIAYELGDAATAWASYAWAATAAWLAFVVTVVWLSRLRDR